MLSSVTRKFLLTSIPKSAFRSVAGTLQVCRQLNSNNSMPTMTEPTDRQSPAIKLDKELFRKQLTVPYLEVEVKHVQAVLSRLKKYLLKISNMKPVQDIETPSTPDNADTTAISQRKILLFDPERISTLTEEDRKIIRFHLSDPDAATEFRYKEIELNYDHCSGVEILNKILPEGVEHVSAFSLIGHILHLNLRDEHEPYKDLIGQVLLDKTKGVKLVVNKTGEIHSKYRNFEMEILARSPELDTTIPGNGDSPATVVTVKESNCQFRFDFATVYWNPRLSTEHGLVVDQLQSHRDFLYDVMAGVGPFAIPAARGKHCRTLANDLNPECVKWLTINRDLNKIPADMLEIYNLDGRQFIRSVLRDDLLSVWRRSFTDGRPDIRIHVTMNLPAIAMEFLDAFPGLTSDLEMKTLQLDHTLIPPMVHVYAFLKGDQQLADPTTALCDLVERHLTHRPVSDEVHEVKFVRNVAPYKDMYRLSFRIPLEVLFRSDRRPDGPDGPETKKIKLDS